MSLVHPSWKKNPEAQYLAVPAINFFGLPGYQQDVVWLDVFVQFAQVKISSQDLVFPCSNKLSDEGQGESPCR